MSRCFIAVCAVLITTANALSAGTPAEEQWQEALAIIEHQETNLSRLKLEYEVYDEQVDLQNIDSGKLEKLTSHDSLIVDGERRRLESHLSLESDSRNLQLDEVRTYDGKRYCVYAPGESAGAISTGGTTGAGYFAYVYGSKKGLLDRLRNAQKKMQNMEVETVEEEGRSLLKVTFKNDLSEIVFLLDPDAAYQPRRITRRADIPAHRVDATGVLKEKTELLITGYLRQDGFCLPQNVEYYYDRTRKDGTVLRVLHREFALTKATLNPPVDPDLFQIRFPGGTQLTLYDIGVTFTTDAPLDADDVEKTHFGARKTTSTAHSDRPLSPEAQPLVAKRGSWKWFLYIPIIAVICIGAFMVFRKRRAKFGRSDDKAVGGRL